MTVTETPKRKVKGIWIPIEIWEHKELTLQQKVFLAEIDSLSNNGDGCWASNAWFADQFGISQDRASRVISSLVSVGLISLTLRYKENSKEIVRRTLKILGPLPVEVPGPLPVETPIPPGGSTGTPPGGNTKDRIYKKENIEDEDLKDFGAAASQPSPDSSFGDENVDLEGKNNPSTNSNQNPPKQTKKKSSKSTKNVISPNDRIKAERVLKKYNECLKILKQKRNLPPSDGWNPLDVNLRPIVNIFKNHTYKDCIKVLETKIHDPDFEIKWYVPFTLFDPEKFEKYFREDPSQYKKQNKGPSNGSGLSGMKYDKPGKVAWMDIGVDFSKPVDPDRGKFTPQWMLDQEAEEARNKEKENQE